MRRTTGTSRLAFADISTRTVRSSTRSILRQYLRYTGISKYQAAVAAGLVKVGPGKTMASVLNDLEKGTAGLWRGEAYIDYCEMDGDYSVIVQAIDQNDNYSPELVDTFLYVPVAGGEFDFRRRLRQRLH